MEWHWHNLNSKIIVVSVCCSRVIDNDNRSSKSTALWIPTPKRQTTIPNSNWQQKRCSHSHRCSLFFCKRFTFSVNRRLYTDNERLKTMRQWERSFLCNKIITKFYWIPICVRRKCFFKELREESNHSKPQRCVMWYGRGRAPFDVMLTMQLTD